MKGPLGTRESTESKQFPVDFYAYDFAFLLLNFVAKAEGLGFFSSDFVWRVLVKLSEQLTKEKGKKEAKQTICELEGQATI